MVILTFRFQSAPLIRDKRKSPVMEEDSKNQKEYVSYHNAHRNCTTHLIFSPSHSLVS